MAIENPEIVVCSAVEIIGIHPKEKYVRKVFSGVRHHAILQSKDYHDYREWLGHENIVEITEGFLTNLYVAKEKEYRFVDREEAKELVRLSSQKTNPKTHHKPREKTKYLFSEDLY